MSRYPKLMKLKGRLVERGETYRSFSEKLGVQPALLSNKLNGKSLFDIVEVSKICAELDISPSEIPVFFSVGCETQ